MTALQALEDAIATITIRGLDDEVRRRLRVRAAAKGVSMEAEARAILAAAVDGSKGVDAASGSWLRGIRALVEGQGTVAPESDAEAANLSPEERQWAEQHNFWWLLDGEQKRS